MLIRSTINIGYFSDQCTVSGHPAQMCRPEAMEWIDRLARTIPGASEVRQKKLYISRGDVDRRAVANEMELFKTLEPRGFELFKLADIPVADQFALMRSADMVVAAHGMGLTYLALHNGPDCRL